MERMEVDVSDQELNSFNEVVNSLSAQFEQMKLERDLALTERDKALNAIIWPSSNIHFEDEHIGQGEQEDLVENWLAEELPQRFVHYVRYDVASMQSLGHQWQVMQRWNNLTGLQKRIFHHYYLMSRESHAFEIDTQTNLSFSWAVCLNFFVTLARSIEKIVPNGCWLVREDSLRFADNRPRICSNEISLASARFVCFLKYNSQALKGNHASHLCNNPDCINDKHVVPEPATLNERRNECFKIGSSSTCQCVPHCLFVRNGYLLPCRNNLNLNECVCDEACFQEVIIERGRRDRIQQNRQVIAPLFDVRPIEEAVFGRNRVGNRCLVINGLNYSERRTYEGYTRWRNYRLINGRPVETYAYSDERVFFLIGDQ